MKLLCLAVATMLFACAPSSTRAPEPAPPSDEETGTNPCREADVAVQILGSGGPIATGRASSGYLVWVGGEVRLVVDIGPGTMLRLAETGATLEPLSALLISHVHVDHSADLAAFAKHASFGERRQPLPVVGPSGSDAFPGIDAFVSRLVGPRGAYPYLDGLVGEGQPFVLQPIVVPIDQPARVVIEDAGIVVRAVGVPHGPVPALGYDVEVRGKRIGFMGDQRLDDPRYLELLDGADLWVAHMAVDQAPNEVAAKLHATPSRIGEVAAQAKVDKLVLSHLMPRSLAKLDDNVATVRASFSGPVVVAEDGACIVVE